MSEIARWVQCWRNREGNRRDWACRIIRFYRQFGAIVNHSCTSVPNASFRSDGNQERKICRNIVQNLEIQRGTEGA